MIGLSRQVVRAKASGPKRSTVVSVIAVGGGSGGSRNNYMGSGGGAGKFYDSNPGVTPGTTYNIIIGGGGGGGSSNFTAGGAGNSTSAFGVTVDGAPTPVLNGANSGNNTAPTTGNAYSSVSGWTPRTNNNSGWGGGGSLTEPIGNYGGYGRAGWDGRMYAAGGGGPTYVTLNTTYAGLPWPANNRFGSYDGTPAGFSCGGGIDASDAPANSGSGGGGGSNLSNKNGASGGSGVVVIRQNKSEALATTTGSPTITTDSTYRYYRFTGSGTIKF